MSLAFALPMDALELFRSEHGRIRGLFRAIESSWDERVHRALFSELRADLARQLHLKASLFYPLFERYPELTRAIRRAYAEHEQLQRGLRRTGRLLTNGDWRRFQRRVRILMRKVERRLDTEESEIFPIIARILSEQDLGRLGHNLKRVRDRLTSKAA